ncbi:MAG: hypothetical protein ACRDTD_13605 [Pseudonocardiaceae bacterium]
MSISVYAGGMAQSANKDKVSARVAQRRVRDLARKAEREIKQAVIQAEKGRIAHVKRQKHEEVVVMPAALAEEALEALEDAKDVETARAIMARRASGEIGTIPHEEVLARFAADLEDEPAR